MLLSHLVLLMVNIHLSWLLVYVQYFSCDLSDEIVLVVTLASLRLMFQIKRLNGLARLFYGVCVCVAASWHLLTWANFCRTCWKWELWASTSKIKSQEKSDNRKILAPEMGNQWHSRICLRRATTRWLLPSHSSWGSCSEARQRGLYLSNSYCQTRFNLCTHVWSH